MYTRRGVATNQVVTLCEGGCSGRALIKKSGAVEGLRKVVRTVERTQDRSWLSVCQRRLPKMKLDSRQRHEQRPSNSFRSPSLPMIKCTPASHPAKIHPTTRPPCHLPSAHSWYSYFTRSTRTPSLRKARELPPQGFFVWLLSPRPREAAIVTVQKRSRMTTHILTNPRRPWMPATFSL